MNSFTQKKLKPSIFMGAILVLGAALSGCQSYTNSICNSTNTVDIPNLEGKYIGTSKGDKDVTNIQITRLKRSEFIFVTTEPNHPFEGKASQLVACKVAGQIVFEQRDFTVAEDGTPQGSFSLLTFLSLSSLGLHSVDSLVFDEEKLKALNIPFERDKGWLKLWISVKNAGIPAEKLLQATAPSGIDFQLTRVK